MHTLLKTKGYEQACSLIADLKPRLNAKHFPATKNSYTRHILNTADNYWLMVINWCQGAQTPIHGHPEQSFVYLLIGQFLIKNYDSDKLTINQQVIYQPNQHYINHGRPNRLDNAIHQVIATEQSLSLHFYSDDPRKGKVFDCA